MKITVTKNDLDGVYIDTDDCPIARAVKRSAGTNNVTVTLNSVYIEGKRYQLPRSADNKAHDRAERITNSPTP
jgi:uncharacterized protein YaiI (UPF0178 family)